MVHAGTVLSPPVATFKLRPVLLCFLKPNTLQKLHHGQFFCRCLRRFQLFPNLKERRSHICLQTCQHRDLLWRWNMKIRKVKAFTTAHSADTTQLWLSLLASEDMRPMLWKLLLAQRSKLNEEPSHEISFLSVRLGSWGGGQAWG